MQLQPQPDPSNEIAPVPTGLITGEKETSKLESLSDAAVKKARLGLVKVELELILREELEELILLRYVINKWPGREPFDNNLAQIKAREMVQDVKIQTFLQRIADKAFRKGLVDVCKVNLKKHFSEAYGRCHPEYSIGGSSVIEVLNDISRQLYRLEN